MMRPTRQGIHREIGGRSTYPHHLVGTDEASDLAQEQITLARRARRSDRLTGQVDSLRRPCAQGPIHGTHRGGQIRLTG